MIDEKIISVSKEAYSRFIGKGMYVAIFLIAILYILLALNKKEKENKKIILLFAIYPIIILILNVNPIFAKLLIKILGGEMSTYWRVYWLIPIGFVLAYFFTQIIFTREKRIEKTALIIACIAIIVICGDFIYTKENYAKADNYYKIPDEVLDVMYNVKEDKEEYKKIAGPEEISVYARQVDGTILLAQIRNVSGKYSENSIVTYINNNDYSSISTFCKETKTNYLVLCKEKSVDINFLYNNGFDKFYENEKYVVLKMKNVN